MSAPRKSIRKKRQTQLSFSPLPSSSPVASRYPDQIQRRAASVRYDSDASSPAKRRRMEDSSPNKMTSSPLAKSIFGGQNIQVVVESPSKRSAQLPTPAISSQVEVKDRLHERGMHSVDPGVQGHVDRTVADSSSDNLQIRVPKSRPSSGANVAEPIFGGLSSTQSAGSMKDFSSEEDDVPVPSARRNRAPPIRLSSDEDSGPQALQKPVTPMKRPRVRPVSYTVRSDFSDESEVEAPAKKLRQKLSISPQSNNTVSSTDRGARRSKERLAYEKSSEAEGAIIVPDGSEGSSSEDIVATPARKRRNTAQLRSPAQETNDSAENDSELDLQDEVDDLKGTSDIEIRETRTRGAPGSSARNARQQKLEELRRRRAGITEEEEEAESEQNDSDVAEISEPEPIHHAMRRGGNLDKYEEDFVDDDDDTLGVEMDSEALRRAMPIEFTHHANKKTIEHFKDEVEWMVHNKLNPAFDRYDEIYEVAHQKLDDEFKAYAGSKFISPVWAPEFDAALKARPDFYRTDIPTMMEHKCDACRRANHPPKHGVTFTGKPYNRKTLEPIVNDDEDDDDSDQSDDSKSSSSEHEENFFLGSFCCANAEMGHALYHWRYALNHNVLEWLAMQGHMTPQKIVERDNMPQKKREKIANKIVDGMEATGVMRKLYREFKEGLAAARDAKPTRFSNHR